MAKFDWVNDQTIREFVRVRWADGKSAAKIAGEWTGPEIMTKNDVIGALHTHRLGEARPSPIRNATNPRVWTEEQTAFLIEHPNGNLEWLALENMHTTGAVKAKLHDLRVSGKIVDPRPRYVPPTKPVAIAALKPVIVAPTKPVAMAAPTRTRLRCEWLNGSAPPNWDQCTAAATHGQTESSWCDAHRSRVFVRRGQGAEAA